MKILLTASLVIRKSSIVSRKPQLSIFKNNGDTPQKYPKWDTLYIQWFYFGRIYLDNKHGIDRSQTRRLIDITRPLRLNSNRELLSTLLSFCLIKVGLIMTDARAPQKKFNKGTIIKYCTPLFATEYCKDLRCPYFDTQ